MVVGLSLSFVTSSYEVVQHQACKFAAWMFYCQGLQHATIKTYLAGVSFVLFINNMTPGSIWHPRLNRVVSGIARECSIERPLHDRCKLPFTRSMILIAFMNVLDNGSLFSLRAIHAALCVGIMFLFRRSEFLTDASGHGKVVDGKPVTLLADDVHCWYGDDCFSATSRSMPTRTPDFISMFLAQSKGDQYGKGATRFFPSDPSCPTCLVKIVHAYILEADLSSGQHLFAGPKFVVTVDILSATLKATATFIGLPADRVSIHSIRVGGLVSLFAADVPDSLKQLAGRWASQRSFVAYARATMQQFTTIASALNDANLVTADHVRKFYN